MALFQLLPDIYVPTFEMKVGGKALRADIAKTILDISVTEHLDPPSQFGFSLNDPKLEFIKKEGGEFAEGKLVEISIGFVGNTRRMMVGEISAVTADFPSSGPATVRVEGFDLVHKLTLDTKARPFGGPNPSDGMSDSDIVQQLAEEVGLSSLVDPTPRRSASITKPEQTTNLAFLEGMVEANGFYLWVDERTLNFKRQPPMRGTVALEWGKTLMSFSPRLSTSGQVNAIEVRGWDPIQKQVVRGRAERRGAATTALSPTGQQQVARGAGGRSVRTIAYAHVRTAQEAQTLADSLMSQQDSALITGNGTSAGPPDIRVGTILDLSGIERFDGEYLVEQVTHSVGSGGYQTSFQVKARL